jgi:hypothetical protein
VAKVAEQNGHVKPEAQADPDTAPNSDSSLEPSKEKVIEGDVPPTEAAEPAPPKAEAEAEDVKAVADAEPRSGNKSETEEKEQLKLQLQPGEDDSASPADVEGANLEQVSSPQSASDEAELERIKQAAEEKAAIKARHPPPPPPRHPGPGPVRPVSTQCVSPEKSTHSPGKFDKPEEPRFAPDGTPYVGDGTWEERTWKELTRLREDAFWARVGRAQ